MPSDDPIARLQKLWLGLSCEQRDRVCESIAAQLPARVVEVLLGALHDHAGSEASAAFKGPLRELLLAAPGASTGKQAGGT